MKLLTSTQVCRKAGISRGVFGYRTLKLGLRPSRQEIRNGRAVSLWAPSIVRALAGRKAVPAGA